MQIGPRACQAMRGFVLYDNLHVQAYTGYNNSALNVFKSTMIDQGTEETVFTDGAEDTDFMEGCSE